MNDNIESHGIIYKLQEWLYALICTITAGNVIQAFVDMSVHVGSTLFTMVFCYFAFNFIRNWATIKSVQYKWIKKFLHKDKGNYDKETIDELTEQ